MKKTNVPEPLATILYKHFDVNGIGRDWPKSLRVQLSRPEAHEQATLFRKQFAGAILYRTVTTEDYEKLTGEDFDTADDLHRWLLEAWKSIYGDEPVSESDPEIS